MNMNIYLHTFCMYILSKTPLKTAHFLFSYVDSDKAHDEDDEDSEDESENQKHTQYSLLSMPCKMVFLVCMDLKMDKGKIAAQVGHATLGAYKKAQKYSPSVLVAWSGKNFWIMG